MRKVNELRPMAIVRGDLDIDEIVTREVGDYADIEWGEEKESDRCKDCFMYQEYYGND